jgi:ribosomal protein S27AE
MTTTDTRQAEGPKPLYSRCICLRCNRSTFALWLAHGQRKRCGECGAVMVLVGGLWVVEGTDSQASLF